MRKRRPSPGDEGCLKKIAELFIAPLVNARPVNMATQTWLEYLFHVEERSITEYICTHQFDIPGLFKLLPSRPVQGFGYRTVRVGSSLWVRIDTTQPDRIDVEVHNGQGKKEQVFQLTAAELKRCRRFFTEAPKLKGKRRELIKKYRALDKNARKP